MKLQPNKNFAKLPEIRPNDFVHLLVPNEALLKCRVLNVNDEELTGVIDSLYHPDPNRDLRLKAGQGLEEIGRELKFGKRFVHAVIHT